MELQSYIIRKELIQIFKQVSTVFEENEFGITMRPAINAIYKAAGRYIKNELNYDFIAKSFNRAFFLLNFLKNLVCLDIALDCGFTFDSDILDIGCGSAPASIAAHKLSLVRGLNRHHFTLIDKSQRQIQMAQTLCDAIEIDLKSHLIEPFHFRDCIYNGTAIFSYFVCEQDRNFINKLYQQHKQFEHGFVVVDYDYIVNHVVNAFSLERDCRIQTISVSATLPEEIANSLHRDEVTVYGCIYTKED